MLEKQKEMEEQKVALQVAEAESCCGPECCENSEETPTPNSLTHTSAALRVESKPDQHQELKKIVQQKYGEIAQNEGSCCGPSCCGPTDISPMNESYSHLEGYIPEADMGLGCGIPTEHAQIQAGNRVLDLGSGAGNDVFVARSLVGPEGQVIGVDMTPEMIEKANGNKAQLGYENVEFRLGDIEDLPVRADRIDVVVSNCVMNLVPDKLKAYQEVYRVLKPGGHFSISDIVIEGDLPEALRQAAELYVGCVAGSMEKNNYLNTIHQAGFQEVVIATSRPVSLPDDLLNQYLSASELEQFKRQDIGILSVTVKGKK